MKKTIQELRLFDGFILTLTIDLIKSIRSKTSRHLIIGNYSFAVDNKKINLCLGTSTSRTESYQNVLSAT